MTRIAEEISLPVDGLTGNTQPMYIMAARFMMKSIGQSVPYPGCANTITMTLSTNIPLLTRCPTRIRVSNLYDESTKAYDSGVLAALPLPIVPQVAGPISLTGFQHIAKDRQENPTEIWWAPGFCTDNSTLGTEYFKEQCEPVDGSCTVSGTAGQAMWENGIVDLVDTGSVSADVTYDGAGGTGFEATYAAGVCTSFVSRGSGYTSGFESNGENWQVNKRLTMWVAKDTEAGDSYVVQFETTNPIKAQRSPDVMIEGKIGDDSTLQGAQFIQDTTFTVSTTNDFTSDSGRSDTVCGEDKKLISMDKDSTTILCCTSCSYANGAVAADSTRTSDDWGQLNPDGDAEPLKVHAPYFCTRRIGQSTPYPCANNTLTVTFTANTIFTANSSMITITGLENAIATDGPIDLMDGPNSLGHDLYFAAEVGGPAGQGMWDSSAKTLTLQVIKDTECATEYVFAFTVTNPSFNQSEPVIMIEASNVGNSEDMFQSGVSIPALEMAHDTNLELNLPFAEKGDASALRIWVLEFEESSSDQSNSGPCAENTISVSFRTNIPLLRTSLCAPILAFTGFTNAIAASGAIDLTTATTMTFASSDGSLDMGEWDNANKELHLYIEDSTMADTAYSFEFIVSNPAGAQVCQTISVSGSGCGDIHGQAHGVDDVLDSASGDMCTMTVEELDFDSYVATQSSPFPCDNNTITLSFSINVPMLVRCSPQITISGLSTAVGPMAGNITLADVQNGGATLFNMYGEWGGPGDGTLLLTPVVDLAASTEYSFSFTLVNPSSGQSEAAVLLEADMSSAMLGSDAGDTLTAFSWPTSGTQQFDYETSVAEIVIAGKSTSDIDVDANDLHPLYIREPTLLMAVVAQSSKSPCESNTISVTLQSNVPLLTTAASGCMPNIIVSDLAGSATASGALTLANMEEDGSATDVFNTPATWEQTAGDLAVSLFSTLLAGPEYEFTFDVTNPAQGRAAATPSVSVWGTTAVPTPFPTSIVLSVNDEPLYVEDVAITAATVSQDSATPCDDNTITVGLTLNVGAAAACNPTLTVSGLTNSATPDVASVTSNSGGAFTVVSWNQSTGTLILSADADVTSPIEIE
eukprot:680035-Rhodomonas_salina.1